MPIRVSYPGVYVEEVPGGQPVTAGVSTASTAFVDFFARGPMNKAVRITSMGDFNRIFGGLHLRSEASYGLKQYFLNGGQEAWVVRASDGTAKSSTLDVRVKTPGLAARFQWATESAGIADKAQKAAQAAAEAAQAVLATIDTEKDTAQELEQKSAKLRGDTTESATETKKATAATRDAAVQAKASSDELAIAIAALAAAAGPVASRTANAAQHTADAATASGAAATTNKDVIAAAQAAVDSAKEALKHSQAARTVQGAAQELADALKAIDAAKDAAQQTDSQNSAAKAAEELTPAAQAAVQAADSATEAAEQAEQAVRGAQSALGVIYDQTQGDDAKSKLDDLAKLDTAKPATDAAKAGLTAQTAVELKEAQDAANAANTAAQDALKLVESAKDGATFAQKTLLSMAADAAEGAAKVAQRDQAGKSVDDANLAILQASDAAKAAMVAAKLASADAKAAASSVGSAAVNLAAREAVSGAEKAANRTAAALKQAKAVISQLNQTLVTALQSVDPANEAAKAAKEGDAGIQQALDAAQAALNAANNALAAAETVEKAAVEVSNVTREATLSADLAARAAKVAVDANEEAGRPPTLRIAAANEGIWGDNLQVDVEVQGTEFSLLVSEYMIERGVARRVNQESYNRLNLEKGDNRFAVELLNEQSKLVHLDYVGPMVTGAYPEEVEGKFLTGGDDGGLADASQLTGADGALMALEDIQPFIFNLLALPSVGSMPGGQATVAIANAQAYCAKKRAFFIVDVPAEVDDADKMLEWVDEYGNAEAYHMAVYFPRLVIPDPLQDFRPRNVGPSGTLAGVYARTDNQRGVWKAPAGINAVLQGAEVAAKITDDQNGVLNPRGVNVLRSFPIYGNISWGARTLAGADAISSEWKYVNVRRLLNYIEESLYQSLKWAVFEPNDEELWSKLRMQVATFLAGLFSQGAFQGTGEGSSYFVLCDGTTTTPVDIDLGVVNVDVGVAPVKPAEFVVLHFQQIAGQAA